MTPPAGRRLRGFGRTDIGRIRERNEDAFALGDLDAGTLWPGDDVIVSDGARGLFAVVCDGMGGAPGGEVAAELAVATTWRVLRTATVTDDPERAARVLRRAVCAANQRVHAESRREPGLRGMGTTLSACLVTGSTLVCAQIGDSRVYVLRDGYLTQVTRDQTVGQALRGAGRITEAEALRLVGGGTILQALGVAPAVEPSLSLCPLRRGDRVLLCSDGLTNQLGESAIGTILGDRRLPRALAEALVQVACAAGGHDNVTAVVLDVDGDALPPPATDPAGDRPRFVELDPREEGARVPTTTSAVAAALDPAEPAIGDGDATAADDRGLASARVRASRGWRWWLPPALIAAALGWWLAR